MARLWRAPILGLCVAGVVAAGVGMPARAISRAPQPCHLPWLSDCGVTPNPSAGDFHGLIAVRGASWLLDKAAHSGTQEGCGDCTWTMVLSCPASAPGDPGGQAGCVGAGDSPACRRHQLLYRVYLTTDARSNEIVGTVCLGGLREPIPVGARAAASVRRYLRDVVPPDLVITTRPQGATLAGLATYFRARAPQSLRPVRFGGPQIRETITIAPTRADWHWGSSATTGWLPAALRVVHNFLRGGSPRIRLASRWGASYTITFDHQTVGPYDVTGRITNRERLTLPVRLATPTLVSR